MVLASVAWSSRSSADEPSKVANWQPFTESPSTVMVAEP
jgi:hypothetical protein